VRLSKISVGGVSLHYKAMFKDYLLRKRSCLMWINDSIKVGI